MEYEFGKEVFIKEDVKYIGPGDDPADHPAMKIYKRALLEVYGQPELSNKEHKQEIV